MLRAISLLLVNPCHAPLSRRRRLQHRRHRGARAAAAAPRGLQAAPRGDIAAEGQALGGEEQKLRAQGSLRKRAAPALGVAGERLGQGAALQQG